MTNNDSDAIAFLFDLIEPMLTEFEDYRIDGALKAAKEHHAATREALRDMRAAYGRLHDFLSDAIEGGRLTEAHIPDDYAAICDQLEACAAADAGAKMALDGIPAPADRAMFDLLCENFDAWDGEEDSVKEEHADLIEKTEAFIDANRARFYPADGH